MRSLCAFLQKTLQKIKTEFQKNNGQLREKAAYAAIICMAVVMTFVMFTTFYTPHMMEAYAAAADFTKGQLLEGTDSTSENTLPVQPEKEELIHDKLATGIQIELNADGPRPEIVGDAVAAAAVSVNAVNPAETKESKQSSKTSEKGISKQNLKKKESENTPKIKISEKDKKVLTRIVEAEATGEDIKGKMLVANVILNRVSDDEFPDNVTSVVFQQEGGKYQFSPISDGRYWDVTISKDSEEAVERVLNGEDSSRGALYFMARKYANPDNVRWFDEDLTWLFQHGVHEFFK